MFHPTKRRKLARDVEEEDAAKATASDGTVKEGDVEHESSNENSHGNMDGDERDLETITYDGKQSRTVHHSVRQQLRQVSFGALLEVSHNDVRPRKQSAVAQLDSAAEKVQVLRERLTELKKIRRNKSVDSSTSELRDTSRSSKHAPAEQSSKRAVTRKRPAIEISSNPHHARDPRFSTVSGAVEEDTLRKNYAFLDEYRANELIELKQTITKVKDPDEKDKLQRQAMAMENQVRASKHKERQRKVMQEHKKQERELIKQGKKPFYLKSNELKKRVLVDKFEGMKGREREKAMKRRRMKESQKEKRNMPDNRRFTT